MIPLRTLGWCQMLDIMKFVSIFKVGIQSHHKLVLDHCSLMVHKSPMRDRNCSNKPVTKTKLHSSDHCCLVLSPFEWRLKIELSWLVSPKDHSRTLIKTNHWWLVLKEVCLNIYLKYKSFRNLFLPDGLRTWCLSIPLLGYFSLLTYPTADVRTVQKSDFWVISRYYGRSSWLNGIMIHSSFLLTPGPK
jgi:hypothetical protein